MSYQPNPNILKRYADLLVNYALGGGSGIKPGEVVLLQVPEIAKPILVPLRQAIIKAGGHLITQYLPSGDQPALYYNSLNPSQLNFFARDYYKGLVKQIDHSLLILAEDDPKALAEVDPKKLIARTKAMQPYKLWRQAKELKGQFTWTLALYGTDAMAKEAGLSLQEYWEQIILACYLEEPNPIQTWKKIGLEIQAIQNSLNQLSINQLHIQAEGTDLTLNLGEDRVWLGGSGRNIPSFEIFTSPDCRTAEGQVEFNEPLYYQGNLIKGIKLEFKKGKVVQIAANQNQALLEEIVKTKNGDRIGEFSLTDSRHSRITKFMAETLFDENRGGVNGNMHLALGSSYRETYQGKGSNWQALGYNESPVHVDIISTSPRLVTASLKGGSKKIIYKDGKFAV